MFKNEQILQVSNTTHIVAYFNPKTPVADIIFEMHKVMTQVITESVILYGDLNCRIDQLDSRATNLIEALQLFNLHLVNNAQEMTYIAHNGQSSIDLIFVSEDLIRHIEMRIQPTVERKHQRIEVSVSNPEAQSRAEGTRPKTPIRKISNACLARQHPTMQQSTEANPSASYTSLREIIEKSAIKSTHRKRINEPWFDAECRQTRQAALNGIGTAAYANLRRTYKDTLKRKRLQHDLQQLEEKIRASDVPP